MESVYCLFCQPHKQSRIVEQAPHVFPCRAMNPLIARRKWVNGKVEESRYPMLPGYVFLFSDADMEPSELLRIEGVIRVLRYADGSYALHREDERIARWLLAYDGVLGASKAIREGDRIRVVEGPMKEHGGTIVRVNKPRQRALVEFRFDTRAWSTWMDFDWVEVDEARIDRS